MVSITLLLGQEQTRELNLSREDSIHVSPQKAMLMSAIVPGTGQLYVRKPLKSIIFAVAEAYAIRQVIYWNRVDNYVEKAQKEVGIDSWNQLETSQKIDTVRAITGYQLTRAPWKPEETRNKTYWWLLGIHIISMLDAYVDAHLINFPDDKVEISSFYNKKEYGINCSIKF